MTLLQGLGEGQHDFQHTPPILQAATIPPSIEGIYSKREFTRTRKGRSEKRGSLEWLTDARWEKTEIYLCRGEAGTTPRPLWSTKEHRTALGTYPWPKGCRRVFEKTQHIVVLIRKISAMLKVQIICQPGSTTLKIVYLRYRANTKAKAKTWAALTAWKKVGSLF